MRPLIYGHFDTTLYYEREVKYGNTQMQHFKVLYSPVSVLDFYF